MQNNIKPTKLKRTVHALGKNALTSQPIYEQVNRIRPSIKKKTRISIFLFNDISDYLPKFIIR